MAKADFIGLILFIAGLSSAFKATLAETTDTFGYNPIETQRAECTLISGDVKASAEASVSRKLEGFCATDHLSRAFGNLEYRLLNEINHLRTMINMLLPPLYQQHYYAQPQPQLYQPLPSPPSANTSSSHSVQNIVQNAQSSEVTSPEVSDQIQNESPFSVSQTIENPADSKDAPDSKNTTTADEPPETTTERQLEFKPVQKKPSERNKSFPKTKTGPREFEINHLNNTLLSGADLQIFNYYWKIEQFSEKLKSNVTTLNSPIFSIAGLYLRVKAMLNHLGREFLVLQLEQLTVDKAGDKSNMILKTGDMFKKISNRVVFKHEIVILNQVTQAKDLKSPVFENTSEGFKVPNSAILSGPYSKSDNLLIKIVITF